MSNYWDVTDEDLKAAYTPTDNEKKYGPAKWLYSTKNWPDQRYNWPNMSIWSKAAVISSYNFQRNTRGLEPIPNPYKTGGPRPAPETITKPTPGKEKIYNNPEFRGDVGQPQPYNPDVYPNQSRHRFPSLIELAFNRQRDKLNPVERKEVNEFKEWLKSPEGIKEMDEINRLDRDNGSITETSDSVAGPSGEKRPAEDQGEAPEKALKIDSAKRPADQVEEPPAKKVTTETPTTTTSTTEKMPLPGTAGEEQAKGKAYSGGFDSSSGPITKVARPFTSYNSGKLVFSKVIRVLTYGLGPTILKPIDTAVNTLCINSSLAEIPWDRFFMYMNPGEFASLPPACFAKHAHVSIVQRNPRVAFQTSESVTSLATLNQNKFGVKAIGLNKNPMITGANRALKSVNTPVEPMIPASWGDPDYSVYPVIFYGYAQNDVKFDTNVPSQPFMVPVAAKNYWCTYNYANSATSPAPTGRQNAGWPDVGKYIEEFDMNATSGTEILSCDYSFDYCPITKQLDAVSYIKSDTTYYAPQPKIAKITANTITAVAGSTSTSEAAAGTISSTNYDVLPTITSLIDRSYNKGDNTRNQGYSRSVMPSVHVGVKPVPRLTASEIGGPVDSYTDVQAYFEVKCTLECGYYMDHSSTQYTKMHTNVNDVKMGEADLAYNTNNPIVFGTYVGNFTI